jgi:hypothetical protein
VSPWRAVVGFGVVRPAADTVYEGARSVTGEQQRVAGQEEADQQPALGEQDDHHPEQPEGVDQVLGSRKPVTNAR